MRKLLSKILPLTLAGTILLSAIPALALRSDAYGEELTTVSTQLHQGTELIHSTYWSDYYKNRRAENYFTYTPNEDVALVAYAGETVTGKATVLNAANSLAQEGYRIVAGINADFFDSNGTPTGLLVSGGQLLSSDGGNNAVGFTPAGGVVIGMPSLSLRGSLNGEGSAYIAALNKARNSHGGIYAYTYDFNTKHTTGTIEAGVDVIMEEVSSRTLEDITQQDPNAVSAPAIGKTAYYQVVEVVEQTAGATHLREGQFVLSANKNAAAEELNYLRGMQPGDLFGLTVTAPDTTWNDVTEAVGGLYMLVKNGVAQSNFEASNAPRTAVGVKANGDVVFYTVDGRKSGHSIGSSLGTLAQRLVELGCVSAICLDGGGSTTAVATTPDSLEAGVLNVPSDGAERKVSSFLFLVADDQPTRDADHVYLAADSQYIMAGSSVEIRANLVDTNFIPMSGRVSLRASDGEIRDSVFTAPDRGGDVTITGSSGSRDGELLLHVVETPDEIQIWQDSAKLEMLNVQPGQKVDLSATALYKHMTLATQDSDFTWSVTGNIGSIDENGIFTAANIPDASGSITLSKGRASASVTVTMSKMPLQTLEDFESSTIKDYSGYGIVARRETSNVRFGASSLRLDYNATDDTGAAVQLGIDVAEGYSQLTLSVYSDGSGNVLSLYTNAGETIPLMAMNTPGWQTLTVPLPDGTHSIQALVVTTTATPSGTIYLDQFVSTYGDLVDTTPPVIGKEDLHYYTIQATVTDHIDGELPRENMELTCDGVAVSPVIHGGVVSADLSSLIADGKSHLIALTAWDASGNRTRTTWEVKANDGAASPFVDNVNADGSPHWAAPYLDRLYELGVLTGEEEGGKRYVRPDRNMTRMEFAVMMFRYLGLQAEDYADVKLPFADNDKIQEWAVPAVKAMYTLGIMQGSQEPSGLYFSPSATITRAQAITMLGRIQEKGYANADLSAFTDSRDVASWALPYVQTMVAQGILSGSDGKLTPNAPMTRAQACKVLYMMQ